jgi:cytosine/adenosine deaminase-related metal-dependent hydrolase
MMIKSLLLKNADLVLTMDDERREIRGADIHIVGNEIVAVEPSGATSPWADEVIDLSGHIVCPGFINTHHHMFQSLTRAVPAAQEASLFDWLGAPYP